MTLRPTSKISLKFHPVTLRRWPDMEQLFGERGACGGCWCMWWRLTKASFEKQKGSGNKRAMKKIVSSGEIPGIIGYHQGKAVAWCSVAPRDVFPRLDKTRNLKRIDDKEVWSIVCLYVAKPFRNMGVSARLLKAAVDYAAKKGAAIIEGYPYSPGKHQPDPFVYMGLTSAYRQAGFIEVAQPSPTRQIMRYYIDR